MKIDSLIFADSVKNYSKLSYLILVVLIAKQTSTSGQNYTQGENEAMLFGIHEIVIEGAELPDIHERYSIFPLVCFSNGNTEIIVRGFYDGNGKGEEGVLWKARLYVTKEGSWTWKVKDSDGIKLKSTRNGFFKASDGNQKLLGKLRKHRYNPNRWATERNTDKAFLALGDTQYTLMDKKWDTEPDLRKGGAGDWDSVIDDSYKQGVTLIRAGAFGGYSGWNGIDIVGPYSYPRPNWPWADSASHGNKDIFDLVQLTNTDSRLIYSLNKYEDLYFELIISPKTKLWKASWLDLVSGCNFDQITNYRKYMLARLGAFPNVIFQLVYDIDFGAPNGGCGLNEGADEFGAENFDFAENWLRWLRDNDPFDTMRGIGNGNDHDDPFSLKHYNQSNPPQTYIHDEAIGDISGKSADKYYGIKNVPLFHGEDIYEVDDIWGIGTMPFEHNPQYYYRRIYWSDLLSGAYPCYGGGYKAIIPYSKGFDKIHYLTDDNEFKSKLHGLDDLIHVKSFFVDNRINLADFHPADSMASGSDLSPRQVQVAYNKSDKTYIIYMPNASKGEVDYDPNDLCEEKFDMLTTHISCSMDSSTIPSVVLKINKNNTFVGKWFDPSTGAYFIQPEIFGKEDLLSVTAPYELKGKDAVLLLKTKKDNKSTSIIGHRGGRYWAPENTLSAFEKCADNYIDWETDLNLTADGEIILMHDMTLDRTTNAKTVFGESDIPVNSKTLEEIKLLDAGSHFGHEYSGEKVPTLDEFLDYFITCAPDNTIISMDTKLDKIFPQKGVYQNIIDKIASRDLFDRVFIEVFDIDKVANTRNLVNGNRLKYAIWVGSDTTLLNTAIESGYFSRIHASSKIAYKSDEVHASGISFFSSHPVDNQQDWDAVKKYNIDGVSTDKVDVAKLVVKNDIPTCSIKTPTDGSIYSPGSTITIEANVGDSDSSISKVEFYENQKFIGFDNSSPYSYSWFVVDTGKYILTAKVYDNGLTKVSVPVQINVEKE